MISTHFSNDPRPATHSREALNAGAAWTYHLCTQGQTQRSAASLEAALVDFVSHWKPFCLPTHWDAWLGTEPEGLATPLRLQHGTFDLSPLGPFQPRRSQALLRCTITLAAPSTLTVLAAADWWMHWHCDGEPCLATPNGNLHPLSGPAHRFQRQLDAGTHQLSVQVLAGTRAWALRCEAFTSPPPHAATADWRLEAHCQFTLDAPDELASLSLEHGFGQVTLNGTTPSTGSDTMRRRVHHGIPPSAIQAGANELRISAPLDSDHGLALVSRQFNGVAELAPLPTPIALFGHRPDSITLSQPILQAASASHCTVT
ncbi:MAG: hypothetical protein PF961_11470, partial [Planctomycetota bacterium]|nr:hypothetical protein [Planctomycetota bacterium]